MIEINLVPPDLRKKKKKRILPAGFNIPLEVVIGIGGGVLVLLVCLDVFLVFLNIKKIAQHKDFKKQWEEVLPAKENVDSIISQMRDFKVKEEALAKMTNNDQGIVWAKKLNILSDSLPRGVWLNKVSVAEDIFFISGSAISRQKREMISVHSFAANLKKEKIFLEGFRGFELGSIERRNVSSTEIADFLITIKIAEK
jgi:Tfp pilus assembly protein PilN